MPYGMPKDIGGDNASNDSAMERRVKAIQAHGHSKSSAIAIAKAAIIKEKRHGKRGAAK